MALNRGLFFFFIFLFFSFCTFFFFCVYFFFIFLLFFKKNMFTVPFIFLYFLFFIFVSRRDTIQVETHCRSSWKGGAHAPSDDPCSG